jgi:hypothetical protein
MIEASQWELPSDLEFGRKDLIWCTRGYYDKQYLFLSQFRKWGIFMERVTILKSTQFYFHLIFLKNYIIMINAGSIW